MGRERGDGKGGGGEEGKEGGVEEGKEGGGEERDEERKRGEG